MKTPWLMSPEGKLVLVPYTSNMVTEEHVRWLNNKKLMKFSEQRHKDHTIASQTTYVNSSVVTGNSLLWLIKAMGITKGELCDCGTASAYLDLMNKTANLGILVRPDRHRSGVGFHTINVVNNYLASIGYQKIEMGMMSSNEAMKSLARKCGFKAEGVISNHFLVEDKRVHKILYGKWIGYDEDTSAVTIRGETSKDI